MKKLIVLGLLMILSGLCFMHKDEIMHLYYDAMEFFTPREVTLDKNEYYREYDFLYLQNTTNFEPQNVQDIINIFYTVINSGQDTFTFYCPREYTNCTNDVVAIANDQTKLSHINNFVHPYNGFKHIETQYSSLGEVTISVYKNYTDEDIVAINQVVESLSNQLITATNSDVEKIKIIHDYIINNSKYDSARSDYNVVNYKSDIAYGPLLQHYGICGGYSDAMQLFLEEIGIKNYKVSSDTHVWNAIYLDGTWYHLDLTWDDPVTSNNTDVLEHDYFLISTDTLLGNEPTEHNFNQDIYLELKQA